MRVGDGVEGFPVAATRDGDPGEWETFERIESEIALPAHPGPLDGILQISPEGWRAGGKLRLPLFCHAGDLFLAYTEGKDVDTPLNKMQESGFHGVRFWVPLIWRPEANNSFWGRRACSPVHTENFYGKLREFIGKLKDRNLVAYPGCGGLSGATNEEETSYYTELAELMAALGPEWFFLPGEVNESRDTGDSDDRDPREIERLVNILRGRHPQVSYALSGYTGDTTTEQAREWTPGWMGFVYFHGYRDGHYWDKIRHMFNNGYENYSSIREYAFVGEDVGPGKWLSVTQNKAELDAATMGLIAAAAAVGGVGYTYICSPGIIFDEPFENMPGFWNLPALYRALPQDVMSWTLRHHSGDTFARERVFSAIGEFRVDGRLDSDGRFVYVAYGPGSSVSVPVCRDCEFDVIDPATAQILSHEVKRAGETYNVAYHRGVVLVGRAV
ncbi:MAG: hypothetical protein LC723_06875 [Actinobacteria bacterium]|nr:hypothetical protein [Actinomycetota bacterium]